MSGWPTATKWIVASVGLLTLVAMPGAASATNEGTEPGDDTEGCAVSWYAQSVMDVDLTNDDPNYPNLMTNLDGTPVDHYSNGGYVYEVRPEYGAPGILEVNHFYQNASTPSPGTTAVWRIPVSTDSTIYDTTITVTLPEGTTASTPVTTKGTIDNWGDPYSNYTWTAAPPDVFAPVDERTWTVDLDTLEAGTGVVFQFEVPIAADTDLTQQYVADARLTGTYAEGAAATCPIPNIPEPELPQVGECERALAGRTIMPVDAPDIETRNKYGEGGEVNADGWGAGANRTFRLYVATDDHQRDVTYVAEAVRGFVFEPGTVSAVVTGQPSGMGSLYGNGYVVPAFDIGTPMVNDSGRTVTLTIGDMPARSAVAFTITGLLDGTHQAMFVDHSSTGALDGCQPTTTSTTTTTVPVTTTTTVPETTTTTVPETTTTTVPETTTTTTAAPLPSTTTLPPTTISPTTTSQPPVSNLPPVPPTEPPVDTLVTPPTSSPVPPTTNFIDVTLPETGSSSSMTVSLWAVAFIALGAIALLVVRRPVR